MKGNNEFHLNTATMMEAVQMWLDYQMPKGAPTVTGVTPGRNGDHTFVVALSSDADRPSAPQKG